MPRTLVLALDAADPGLVRELADAGEMPAVASLLRDGAQVSTLAPEGVFVSANWPTIFTSLRPDRHRYLCWDEYRGGTYDYRHTTPLEIRGRPFWEALSDAGRRVVVLDVPHSTAVPLNGAMVAEWGCHDRHFGTASWPPELAAELSARFGAHHGSATEPPAAPQFAPCDYVLRAGGRRTPEEEVALFELLVADLERKRDASLLLLDRGGWDAFVTVFGESHCVGHQLWHLHDAEHPFHDPGLGVRLEGDPVRAIYRRLDRIVADHLERLGPQDTAYVLMPHGMTAHHDGTHMLEQILQRLDWSLDSAVGLGGRTQAAAALASRLPRALRGPMLRGAAPIVRRFAGDGGPPAPPPPHAQRRWFQTPNNTVVGAVRLNLAGREPRGRLLPDDRADVLRWLADRFAELVNVDTGGRVVTRCVVTDEIYGRSPDDALADLFIEWDRSAPIERVWSPATGTIAVPYEHWRQGDHVREGLLLARGPGIAPGRRRGVVGTEDLGATFSAAAGVALTDVDGLPIESVLPATGAAAPRVGRRPTGASVLATRARARGALRRFAARRAPAWRDRQDPAIDGVRTELDRISEAVAQLGASVEEARRRGEHDRPQADARMEELAARTATLESAVGDLDRIASLWPARAWIGQLEVAEDALISVVVPTRDRRDALEAALASIEAQTYRRWEALIVDDGSTDDTPSFLASIEDPRVRPLQGGGAGPAAARNAALDAAAGSIVTYLDDDNRFDADWLKAVALTFANRPECDTAFGARVVDDRGRLLDGIPDSLTWVHFEPWDEEALRIYNRVDMSAIAHRRGDARLDPELMYFSDWDLLLKLTADRAPVAIPAIAVYYRTDRQDRISTSLTAAEIEREYQRVRERLVNDYARGATVRPPSTTRL